MICLVGCLSIISRRKQGSPLSVEKHEELLHAWT